MLFCVHCLLENDTNPKPFFLLLLNALLSFFPHMSPIYCVELTSKRVCHSYVLTQIADAVAMTETTSSSLSSSATSSRSSTPKVK